MPMIKYDWFKKNMDVECYSVHLMTVLPKAKYSLIFAWI